MIRFTGTLSDSLMLGRRKHTGVSRVAIGIECRALTIHCGNPGPELLGTGLAAVANMKGQDLARLLIHGKPDLALVRFFLHETPQLVCLNVQTPEEHLTARCNGLQLQMVRHRGKTSSHEIHKPPETYADGATDAT